MQAWAKSIVADVLSPQRIRAGMASPGYTPIAWLFPTVVVVVVGCGRCIAFPCSVFGDAITIASQKQQSTSLAAISCQAGGGKQRGDTTTTHCGLQKKEKDDKPSVLIFCLRDPVGH